MSTKQKARKSAFQAAVLAPLLLIPSVISSTAEENFSSPGAIGPLNPVDPTKRGDGTRSPAAVTAMKHGYVPLRKGELDERLRATKQVISTRKMAPIGPLSPSRVGPSVFSPTVGANFPGLFDISVSPSDSTIAAGPSTFIELVNRRAKIANHDGSGAVDGYLLTLAGINPLVTSADVFDPQILYDGSTQRYYYAMDLL